MKEQQNKEIREIKKGILRCQDSLCELRNTMRLDRIILQSFLANDSLEIGKGELRDVLDRVSDTLHMYCEALEQVDMIAENTRKKLSEVLKNARGN